MAVPINSFLSSDKQRLAKMLKALGNPTRFHMMEALNTSHVLMTGELVQGLFLTQSTVSQHIKILVEAGLIHGEVAGPATRYSIDSDSLRWFKNQVAHWLPERLLPEDEVDF